MIDREAMHALTYGLYLISSKDGKSGRDVGCTVNTFLQVTSDPARVAVTINKENHTAEVIQESGIFAATVIAQSAPMELIGVFGFQTSRDINKFAGFSHKRDAQGLAYVDEGVVARFSLKLRDTLDVGTHLIFVGDVVESEKLSDEEPVPYSYYRQVKGGKVPPKASSYQPDELAADGAAADMGDGAVGTPRKIAWRCSVCGHVEITDELPEDFTCPLCKQLKDVFERTEV